MASFYEKVANESVELQTGQNSTKYNPAQNITTVRNDFVRDFLQFLSYQLYVQQTQKIGEILKCRNISMYLL